MRRRKGFVVLGKVPVRLHRVVKNAYNTDAVQVFPIEDDMPALFVAAKPRANCITASAQKRICGKAIETGLKLAKVAQGLSPSPLLNRVLVNLKQIKPSAGRKDRRSQTGYSCDKCFARS